MKLAQHNAYATGMNDDGEMTYTFALQEATRYDWQADAMNAVNLHNSEYVYYKHDPKNVFEIPPAINKWVYGAI
jgi:hypothetical protein